VTPTIKDVARAAGVSVGTVSHYLNGSVRVGAERSERIREAIAALGYHVDLGARGLRAGTTRTVGLVVPNISNPFFGEVARSIEHALTAEGFQTFLCDSGEDPAREEAYLENLASRRVDGLLVIYADEGAGPSRLGGIAGVPLIFVDRGVQGHASVTIDNEHGGRLAARHLLDLGHRRIAVMIGGRDVANVALRVEGFVRELDDQGAPIAGEYILEGPQSLTFGSAVDGLFALAEPPTAVFTTNDIIAVGVWQKLLSMGLRVPHDVSLIGFDDIELCRSLIPPLTTIAQDKQALGRLATERLLRAISARGEHADRPEGAEDAAMIEPRLIVRESTAPPSRSDGLPEGEVTRLPT
jgi:LacI family transcriptional regulator